MSIDATVVRNPGIGSWQFTWPVGISPYSVYLDGVLQAEGLTTESYEYVAATYEDTPPPLEILDAGAPVENLLYPPRFLIQWRGIQNAAAYVVEQFLSGTWVEVNQTMEVGEGYYSYTSQPLSDANTHMFRVIALDQPGNEGTPLTFTSEIMRNPAPPDVDIAITAGDIVVSAA